MKKIVMLMMLVFLALGMVGCSDDEGTSQNAIVTDALSKIESAFKTNVIDSATIVDGRYAVDMGDGTGYFIYSIEDNKFLLTAEVKASGTYIVVMKTTITVNEDGSIVGVNEELSESTGKLEVTSTDTYTSVDELIADMNS